MLVTPFALALAAVAAFALIAAIAATKRAANDQVPPLLVTAGIMLFTAAVSLPLADLDAPKSATDALNTKIPASDVEKLSGVDDLTYEHSPRSGGLNMVTYAKEFDFVHVTCSEAVPSYADYPQKTKWHKDAAFKKDVDAISDDMRCHVDDGSARGAETIEESARRAIHNGVYAAFKDATNATTLEAPEASKFSDASTTWIVDTVAVTCSGRLPTVDDLVDHAEETLPRLWSTRLFDDAANAYDIADKIDVSCDPMIDGGRRSFKVG